MLELLYAAAGEIIAERTNPVPKPVVVVIDTERLEHGLVWQETHRCTVWPGVWSCSVYRDGRYVGRLQRYYVGSQAIDLWEW